MKRLSISIGAALVPFAFAWLGAMEFVRSFELAFTAGLSMAAFLVCITFPS